MSEIKAHVPCLEKAFLASQQAFDRLLGWLQDTPALGSAHGEVEAAIFAQGTEVLRLAFQGHLELRAAQEAAAPARAVVNAAGVRQAGLEQR